MNTKATIVTIMICLGVIILTRTTHHSEVVTLLAYATLGGYAALCCITPALRLQAQYWLNVGLATVLGAALLALTYSFAPLLANALAFLALMGIVTVCYFRVQRRRRPGAPGPQGHRQV